MTRERQDAILNDLKALTAQLQQEDLPAWVLDRGRALQFHGKACQHTDPQQRLMAIYNGYGMLVGFDRAAQRMDRDLGGTDGRLQQALAKCRQEGDSASGGAGLPLSGEELEKLLVCLRRHILKQ